MNEGNITKEQRLAIQELHKFHSKFIELLENRYRIRRDGVLLPTDFMVASEEPFKVAELPSGPHWSWNQSSSKIVVPFGEGTLTLRKLCPRVRCKFVETPPSFKLWSYQIEYPAGLNIPQQYFLWCEKGQEHGVITSIGYVYPEDISIDQLSFLSPFADPNVAQELGWVRERD